jgi:hypothetical protein
MGVVELTELRRGDVLSYTLKTVYQNTESDPYTGTVTVASVDVTRDDDGAVQEVVVYFREKSEERNGRPARRAVLSDGDLTYERARGDLDNPTWCKFSKDGKFTVSHAECGAETDNGTCGRRAGWGTCHVGRGKCRTHEPNHTAPNVSVGDEVMARLE